ncbi:MAG: hypothetical protein R2699_01110 [Acidimicrobiales bacterium]
MRRWIGAGVLAAVAIGGAACGGGGSDVEATRDGAPATGAALAEAATRTSDAGTGRVEVTMRLTAGLSDVGPGAVELTGSGAFDTQAQRSSMALAMDGVLGMLGNGEGDGEDGGAGVAFETVTDGAVVYVRSPASGVVIDGGDRWVRLDPDELAAEADARGADPSIVEDLDQLAAPMPVLDPAALLDWLTAAGAEVTVVGAERVNGVDTTHQRATLELGDLAQRLDPEARTELERSTANLSGSAGALLDTPLPVDVYVDDEGLVRRVVLTLGFGDEATTGAPGSAGSGGAGIGGGIDDLFGDLSMTITVDYLDLGEPVDIVVPDRADTVGVGDLMDELTQPSTTTTGG